MASVSTKVEWQQLLKGSLLRGSMDTGVSAHDLVRDCMVRRAETREGGLVIVATNRKQDLDAALRSRFDAAVCFDLPSSADRAKIFAVYAQHLSDDDRRLLADASQSFAGRDIRKACEDTERRWAAAMVRGETGSADEGDLLPPLGSYLEAVRQRKETR